MERLFDSIFLTEGETYWTFMKVVKYSPKTLLLNKIERVTISPKLQTKERVHYNLLLFGVHLTHTILDTVGFEGFKNYDCF